LDGGSTFEKLDGKLADFATPSQYEKSEDGPLFGVLSMETDASKTMVRYHFTRKISLKGVEIFVFPPTNSFPLNRTSGVFSWSRWQDMDQC
jgi:hypothetical protein